MRNFQIEVFVDEKPSLKNPIEIKASNVSTAVRRAMLDCLKDTKQRWTKVVVKAIKH
jgi:hypothetical protein